jgi:hypothetical protein
LLLRVLLKHGGSFSDSGFLLVLKGMLNRFFFGYRFTVLQRMLNYHFEKLKGKYEQKKRLPVVQFWWLY